MLAAARSLPRLLILSEFERCRELLALFGRRFLFSGLRVLIAFSAVNARRSSHSTARTGLYVCCEAFRRYSAVIRVDWRSLCAFAFKRPSLFFSD